MPSIDKAIADALTAAYQERPPETGPPEVVIVDVPPDSKLEQLLCLHDERKARHEAADAEWEEHKAALTTELGLLYPGKKAPTKSYEIPPGPMWRPLTVSWREGREYLPTDLIKAHIPQVWTAFKKQSKGFWDIRYKGKR
jgi:hypothetical protein